MAAVPANSRLGLNIEDQDQWQAYIGLSHQHGNSKKGERLGSMERLPGLPQLRTISQEKYNNYQHYLKGENEQKEKLWLPNCKNIRKIEKRGGGHFQSKNLCCRFWKFLTGLLSNFRVQSMFFNNCVENNQNKTHFEEGSSGNTSLRDESGYQIGQIFGKVPNGN